MKILWILLITAFSMSVAPVQALAQADKDFIFPKSTVSRQFPKVTRNYNGLMVVTYVELKGNVTTVLVSTSADSGKTWSHPTSPGTVKYGNIGLQRQPYTVADNVGTLHCIWENNPVGGNLLIYCSRSADNGKTWSEAKPAYVPKSGGHDFSSIAADDDGNVYITFLAYDEQFSDGSKHVFLVRSTDRGETWGSLTKVDRFVAGGSCECCMQNVTVSKSGEVAVAFRSNISNRRDVYVSKSYDNGKTFADPILIQDEKWMINACPSTGPSLVYDATGNLHIAWRDSRNSVGRDVAYYAMLPAGSTTTPKNVSLSGDFSQGAEYPVPAVLDTDPNNVMVVFESTLGVAYGFSSDGGKTFEIKKLDESVVRSSGAAVVFVNKQQPYIMWQTERDGVFDIASFMPTDFTPVSVLEEGGSTPVTMRIDGNVLNVESGEQQLRFVTVHSIDGSLILSAALNGSQFSRSFNTPTMAFVSVQLADGTMHRQILFKK